MDACTLSVYSVYEVKAAEIMQTDVPFVLRHATPQEVASLLSKNKDYNVFPVVQNRGSKKHNHFATSLNPNSFLPFTETMTLNGYAERRDLTNYLLECFQIVYNTIHEKDSLLESNAGRRALAKSMAFAAWEDTQQQQGGRGRSAAMPYGTFGQQQGKAGVVDKKVVTLTEDELLSKFKLFEDSSSLYSFAQLCHYDDARMYMYS